MEFNWSSLSDRVAALGLDPVTAGAGVIVAVLVLLMILRVSLRSKSAPERRSAADADETIEAAPPNRPRTTRANTPIDDRFAALRLQTEEMEANAPSRRHFSSAERPPRAYQLRRR